MVNIFLNRHQTSIPEWIQFCKNFNLVDLPIKMAQWRTKFGRGKHLLPTKNREHSLKMGMHIVDLDDSYSDLGMYYRMVKW